jgi:hypothetical protein
MAYAIKARSKILQNFLKLLENLIKMDPTAFAIDRFH